jgi:hypothetical protein
MEDSKAMMTPMSTTTALDADEEGTRGPEGVPEHDRVTPLFNGDEAGHPVLGMSVRSFSSVSEDFASASGEVSFQVLASYPQLRPLVLHILFFGSSWVFGCGFCRVSVG